MKTVVRVVLLLACLLVGGTLWAEDKVDINTATQAELESLPGIGPALAQKIITYRQTKPFDSIEEIKKVSGIGDKNFEKFKEKITVSVPAQNQTQKQ